MKYSEVTQYHFQSTYATPPGGMPLLRLFFSGIFCFFSSFWLANVSLRSEVILSPLGMACAWNHLTTYAHYFEMLSVCTDQKLCCFLFLFEIPMYVWTRSNSLAGDRTTAHRLRHEFKLKSVQRMYTLSQKALHTPLWAPCFGVEPLLISCSSSSSSSSCQRVRWTGVGVERLPPMLKPECWHKVFFIYSPANIRT